MALFLFAICFYQFFNGRTLQQSVKDSEAREVQALNLNTSLQAELKQLSESGGKHPAEWYKTVAERDAALADLRILQLQLAEAKKEVTSLMQLSDQKEELEGNLSTVRLANEELRGSLNAAQQENKALQASLGVARQELDVLRNAKHAPAGTSPTLKVEDKPVLVAGKVSEADARLEEIKKEMEELDRQAAAIRLVHRTTGPDKGWYFERSGRRFGPYPTREMAIKAAEGGFGY